MRGETAAFAIRSSVRGFTLTEVLVSSAIFLIVVLVAYAFYDAGTSSCRLSQNQSENQQRTRIGFLDIVEKVRLAGFDYNRDGDQTPYPDQTDEQIEFAHPHAITVRANYDFADSNDGREPDLELPPTDPDFGNRCCPIVTTGNDEIVTFALRSAIASANNDTITVKLDAAPSSGRDAIRDATGTILNEETLTIQDVDLDGDSPPYTLIRYTVNAEGTAFVESPLVDNIRTLNFHYADAAGNDWTCLNPESDGSCLVANRLPLANLGGGDAAGGQANRGRKGRAAIRRIHVELTGANEDPDLKWKDPTEVSGSRTLRNRKYELAMEIEPPNLGIKGRVDPGDTRLDPPTNVSICTGQCDTVRVEWDKAGGAISYKVDLFDTSQTPPAKIFSRQTPGVAVEGSTPPRAFAVFRREDDPDVQNGLTTFAKVTAISGTGGLSEPSQPSDTRTLQDVVRPGPVDLLTATGYDPASPDYPDTSLTRPVEDATNPYFPHKDEIVLQWLPPEWTLDVRDQANPLGTWDTRCDSTSLPALACDQELAVDTNADTVPDKPRTAVREVVGDIRYLIFRSTDPHFDPVDSDLIAEIKGTITHETGRITFIDRTDHTFSATGVWQQTRNAIPCCTTFYYRVRSVDSCWSGLNPSSKTDPHLSPFYPKLNTGDVRDSDDTTGLPASAVGAAIPGYSIAGAKAEAPREVRFREFNAATRTFRLQFHAAKRDTATPPEDAAYRTYRLFSHPSDPNFLLDSSGYAAPPGRVDADIVVQDLRALAIARDDEDGDTVSEDHEDETNDGTVGDTDLAITVSDITPRYYRLVAYQCEAEDIAGDGHPTAYDFGEASDAILIPCTFGGGSASAIYTDDSSWPTTYTAEMSPQDPAVTGTKARLILMDPGTGDGVKSLAPGIDPTFPGSNVFLFDTTHIDALLADFPGSSYVKIVEVRDSNGCYGFSDQDAPHTPPACCLEPGAPVAYIVSGTANKHARQDLTETCGRELRITEITVSIGNENGGQPERILEVYWGATLVWQGSSNVAIVDRNADPLIVPANGSRYLRVVHDRSVRGNGITFEYDYYSGLIHSSCTFHEPDLQLP